MMSLFIGETKYIKRGIVLRFMELSCRSEKDENHVKKAGLLQKNLIHKAWYSTAFYGVVLSF